MHAFPGEHLVGQTLDGTWTATGRIGSSGTGGNFSISYAVEHVKTKHTAFMKVLNLGRAFGTPDPLNTMKYLINAFELERNTLQNCGSLRLSRIVTLIAHGTHSPLPGQLPVFYIIFDLASGDARAHLSKHGAVSVAWTLRTLHQLAVAVQQLHTHDIAHQDIKPSNALIFETAGAKLADLGCASTPTVPGSRDHFPVAGDPQYAPLELLYDHPSGDWRTRRISSDLYLLGSMFVFFFAGGLSMTGLIFKHLPSDLHFSRWKGTYLAVLPNIVAAFERAVQDVEASIPSSVRLEVGELLRYLCNPDPDKRGVHQRQHGLQFDLQRLVSRLDNLASRSELLAVRIK